MRTRGFTLIELTTAIVVGSILLLLASLVFTRVLGESDQLAAGVTLSTARVDVARAAYANGSEFPSGAEAFRTPGLTYTANSSEEPEEISVLRVDAMTLVMAARSGDDACVFVVNSLTERPTWGIDPSTPVCSASAAAGVRDQASSTSAEVPTEVSIP